MSSHPAGLPMASVEILASLAQHRLLQTDQVREIHRLGSDRRWAQKVLARLRAAGLVDRVRPPRRGASIWFATARGVDVAREAGALTEAVPILGPQAAMNQLQAHTLAVNDAAIYFLRAARERGEEFGPLSWRHEVLHVLGGGRGRRRRSLVADAVLTYLREEDGRVALEQRFLELDRATLSVERLAAELARYAELHGARDGAGEPLWKAAYPRFPSVVCVLAGERREALERRRSTVIALLSADPRMSLTPEVRVSICLLEDLRREGPFAPIFRAVGGPKGDVDWLRRAPQEGRG
jgi:DNA-binding MarR family transcriptional regulator